MVLALLLACIPDQGLSGKPDDPFDTGDSGPPGDDTGPPVEECNGVDDDGDGEIDEGFADEDGNGRVDCLDATCPPLAVAVAGPVDVDADCDGATGGTEVTDPWRIRVKWSIPAAPTTGFAQSVQPPLVADLQGDGTREIVVLAWSGFDGELVVVDGGSGDILWSATGYYGLGGLGVADVDGDGDAEILAQARTGEVVAVGVDGRPRWTSADTPSVNYYASLTVADLDGDGQPEVIADDLVLDGATGATLARLGVAAVTGREPEVADLDLDGQVELYLGGAAFDPDGALRWISTAQPGQIGHWAAAIQADDDPEGEIVFLGESFGVYDTDGSTLVEVPLEADGGWVKPGVPCIADLDGDHLPEIAYASADTLYVRRPDGTLVWEAPVEDPSGAAGCSATDLDGDGRYEVLFADHYQVWVLDGATGAVLAKWRDHVSDTGVENPVVVDLDDDGDAELLTVQSGATGTTELLVALEHDGAGWYAAEDTWPVHDYDTANVGTRGQVAAFVGDTWRDPGLLRATLPAPRNDDVNLVPVITDLCVADCTYGPVALAFTVENRGTAEVAAGTVAVVFAEDGDARRELARFELPAIPGGSALDGFTVDLTPADLGRYGVGVAVDPPGDRAWGEVWECNERDGEEVRATGC